MHGVARVPTEVSAVVVAVSLLVGGCNPCREPGTVCTIAGTGEPGFNEDEIPATETMLYMPHDVTWRPGTESYVITDWNNEKLREVDEHGVIRTVVGSYQPGDGAPGGTDRVEPGAIGTTVKMNHPLSAEFSPDDTMYIAAWHNHKIRTWDPSTQRVLVVVANTEPDEGNGANAGFAGDGGPAQDALVWFPASVAFGPDGEYYFIDEKNLRVRRVTADGIIDTVAGSGVYGCDDGPLLEATFRFPEDPDTSQPLPGGAIEADADGRLYVADTNSHRVRQIDLEAGAVTTIAGTGEPGYSGDGGSALEAELDRPADVELGPDGTLYVADSGNHVIRAIDLDDATITTVVGTGESGDAEEGALAAEARLNHPGGLDVSDDGAILIADTYNSKIRRVTP